MTTEKNVSDHLTHKDNVIEGLANLDAVGVPYCYAAIKRIRALEDALNSAYAFAMPDIDRGPAIDRWCRMIKEVEPLIGETDGRALMKKAGVKS